ncbi:hypothetical protein [Pseudodesulfovibrio piezophilus]|uniref:Uncharacterized protein n=1 Tax=Pseudodesulfovibrio piezophilus (strain DSM 21447 / JCM 15486 / C1TLV30) TaxID=1322246 RepID=M1WS47_PSEP2|nr:hypothetical protein [Pseudodesulfovibrio piezophilus]CCH48712.1 conserved protein of unknown function [Pseudodesulfovibrio piezophilus C1TLV30]
MDTQKPLKLDILEMPFEGLAAYWLSIKKIMDTKKGRTIIDEERSHTEEPYILHLLETVFSSLSSDMIRRLAQVKKETQLEDYGRKIDLMRIAAFAIASGENPRITLVRMDSKFAAPLISEDRALDMATAMFDAIKPKGVNMNILLSVNHKLMADRLLVKLLFFVMYSRREGKQSLERFLPHLGSRFFSEAVALAIDNFEADFLAYHLKSIRDNAVTETGRKMDMAMEMSLAIRNKLAYEDVFRIARAYLP